MQSIWRLARNWLAGKPGRTALMIAAVAIAASLVVAVSCAIGSVQASMEYGIVKILGATDARIIHPANGRFDESLLATARSWPEVRLASARLGASLTLVHSDRRKNPKTSQLLRCTPNALGVDLSLEPKFRTQVLTDGVWPTQPDEILIDPITAEELQAKPGDVLEVQRFGTPVTLKVAGIFERQKLGTLQRPFVDLDRGTLMNAADRKGQITSIVMLLNAGVDVNAFCEKYASALPEELIIEPAEKARSGFDRQVSASRFGFTIAAVLTFLSASFIIVTAMTTSVTQRQRDMAVIRCVGASRGQLFGSQIIVGVLIGLAGAIVGIPLGLGLTWILVTWFSEYLQAGLRIEALGLQLAIIGSLAAGVLGAIYPAFMASRVTPMQAMSVHAHPPRARSIIICSLIGLVFIALQVVLLAIPDASDRFIAYVYAGMPAVHIGYFLLAVPLVLLVTWGLQRPLSLLLTLPPTMLRGSVKATPFRHGFTAGAMMVGMAILVSTWSTATSILHDWLGKIKFADGFAFRSTGIRVEEQQAIAAIPFVESTCAIGYLPLNVVDRQIFGVRGIAPPNVTCIGFDIDEFFRNNAVEWVAGNQIEAVRELNAGAGVVVADRFLTTQRVNIGDTITLEAGRTRKTYAIVGALNSAGLDIATQLFGIRSQYMEFSISCVFMARTEVMKTFDNSDAHMLQINFPDDVTDEQLTKAIADAAPGVQFRSGRDILKTIDKVAFAMLTVQSTVAFAALVLASIAVGNVILANIQGRRFEYGVLRAIGAHRGLLARLIFAESAIVAITGALVGTLLGLHLAWVGAIHYRELAGLPVVLRVPWGPIAAGLLVVLLLTVIATVPGVRAVIKPRPTALLAAGRNG